MLKESLAGLAIAIFVISSIAWVSQFRKIRDRIRLKQAARQQQAAAKASEWTI